MPNPYTDLFAPPTVNWTPVERGYRTMRQIQSLWILVWTAIPAVVVGWLLQWWWLVALIAGVGIVLTGIRIVLADRYWKSWGYAELDDDLWVTRGVMFRKLTAVPYGRMQTVEITAGPTERLLGICTVVLDTASAMTGARICGLHPTEAVRLRDRLTERGDAKASGL